MSDIEQAAEAPEPAAAAKKEPRARRRASAPRQAFSIPEFCDAHRISESYYYELKLAGLGPVEMKVGRRRIISAEAASEWRRAREATA
jgi:hypothetical protein